MILVPTWISRELEAIEEIQIVRGAASLQMVPNGLVNFKLKSQLHIHLQLEIRLEQTIYIQIFRLCQEI